MVLLHNLLYSGLQISLVLATTDRTHETRSHVALPPRSDHWKAVTHKVRSVASSTRDLLELSQSLRLARRVVEDHGSSVEVPSKTLQGIVSELKMLENHVTELMESGEFDSTSSGGSASSDSSGTSSPNPDANFDSGADNTPTTPTPMATINPAGQTPAETSIIKTLPPLGPIEKFEAIVDGKTTVITKTQTITSTTTIQLGEASGPFTADAPPTGDSEPIVKGFDAPDANYDDDKDSTPSATPSIKLPPAAGALRPFGNDTVKHFLPVGNDTVKHFLPVGNDTVKHFLPVGNDTVKHFLPVAHDEAPTVPTTPTTPLTVSTPQVTPANPHHFWQASQHNATARHRARRGFVTLARPAQNEE